MGDGFMNGYTEGYHDFPVCNHVVGIGPENVGYTTGITWDGLPFEAEVYSYGEGEKQIKEFAIIFPDLGVEEDDCEEYEYEFDYAEESNDEDKDWRYTEYYKKKTKESNVTGFSYEIELRDFSALPIGMVDRGQESSLKIIQWYLEYVEGLGLVEFISSMRSCSVFYYTDVNGNDLVQVRTGLITNGIVEARTDLDFREFPYRQGTVNKSLLKVVK